MKNIRIILSENFQFLEVNLSIYLNRHVFVTYNIFLQRALLVTKDQKRLQADSENSDKPARRRRIIWLSLGAHAIL